jgi:hypothetical protein
MESMNTLPKYHVDKGTMSSLEKNGKKTRKDKTCAADKKILANTLESSNKRQKTKIKVQTQSSRPVGLEVLYLFTDERTNSKDVRRRLSFSCSLCLEVDF